MQVRRHYVTVGNRQVHYRRAGKGPPLLAFHSSPQTGAFVLPYLQDFADRFTLIAPDTPGYGGSDPLPTEYPTIEEYADAAVPMADALGIDKAVVYGTHTGAHIALEYARRHPQRVSLCILDGISFYTAEEQAELRARYAPPFQPTADGAHLAWAWQHTRDQLLFYPWFRTENARRLASSMRDPAYTHQVVLWKMAATWAYRKGYQAAFGHPTLPAVQALTVPAIILAPASDILAPMLSRVKNVPSQVEVVAVPAEKQPWLDAMNRVLDRAAAAMREAPPVPAAQELPAGVRRRYVEGGGGQILVRQRPGKGRPLVLLHGEMEASASLQALMTVLPPGRPLIAPDLPGLGDSDPLPADAAGIAGYRVAVEQVLQALGVDSFDLYARDMAAPLAIEIAGRHPRRVAGLLFDQPVLAEAGERDDLLAHYAPPVAPATDGAYLLSAWHRLRDRALFWPWYRRERAAIRWIEPVIDPAELQLRLVETLKNPAHAGDFARAALAWGGTVRLPEGLKAHLLAAEKDPATLAARTMLEHAGAVLAGGQPGDVGGLAGRIAALLGPG